MSRISPKLLYIFKNNVLFFIFSMVLASCGYNFYHSGIHYIPPIDSTARVSTELTLVGRYNGYLGVQPVQNLYFYGSGFSRMKERGVSSLYSTRSFNQVGYDLGLGYKLKKMSGNQIISMCAGFGRGWGKGQLRNIGSPSSLANGNEYFSSEGFYNRFYIQPNLSTWNENLEFHLSMRTGMIWIDRVLFNSFIEGNNLAMVSPKEIRKSGLVAFFYEPGFTLSYSVAKPLAVTYHFVFPLITPNFHEGNNLFYGTPIMTIGLRVKI